MLVTLLLAPLTRQARELRLSWTAEETVVALDGLTSQTAVCVKFGHGLLLWLDTFKLEAYK